MSQFDISFVQYLISFLMNVGLQRRSIPWSLFVVS